MHGDGGQAAHGSRYSQACGSKSASPLTLAMVLSVLGLTLDIVGVLILFVCTSTRKIESEMLYPLMEEMTREPRELTGSDDPYTPEYMCKWRKSVKTNTTWTRVAMGMICVGFIWVRLF